MRIGIDFLADQLGQSGCIGFHRNFINWISKFAEDEIYYVFVYSKEYEDYKKYATDENKIKLVNIGNRKNLFFRLFHQFILLPIIYRNLKVDRVFSDNLIPLLPKKLRKYFRVLMTQHFHKDFKDNLFRKIFRIFITKYSVHSANVIIVNSEYTKKEITKYCKVKDNKIKVVMEAAHLENFFPIKNKEKLRNYVKEKYNLINCYFLQVSGLYDHKNPLVSIRVLNKLYEMGYNFDFVLVGADPLHNWPRYRKYADEIGVAGHFKYLNFLLPEELNKIYNSSICLIYPSISETFGIPPLEAMACNIPVIGSNQSAVPEVIGDGGILISPSDIESIADIVIKLNSDIKFRNHIINRGKERLKYFSWEKTIKEIRKIIKYN